MTTASEVLAWLDSQTVLYDLRKEVHARNGATVPSTIAHVQAQTTAHLADELRRMIAEEVVSRKEAT